MSLFCIPQVKAIVYSCWGACVLPDPEHPDEPFVADAIVANPPSYGHTHCAEKLNIPLHIVFTMPWSPTKVCASSSWARFTTVVAVTPVVFPLVPAHMALPSPPLQQFPSPFARINTVIGGNQGSTTEVRWGSPTTWGEE